MAASTFSLSQTYIPLFFVRMRGGAVVTGLTVTVTVVDALTGNSLLVSSPCFETSVGAGLYAYSWLHGLTVPTSCLATYSVTDTNGLKLYKEEIALEDASSNNLTVPQDNNLEMVQGSIDEDHSLVGSIVNTLEITGSLELDQELTGIIAEDANLVGELTDDSDLTGGLT